MSSTESGGASALPEVRVWRLPLHEEPEGWRAILSPEEIARAERLAVAERARRFIASAVGLRRVLARELWGDESGASELRFGKGEHGKPFAEDAGDLRFNLTNSRDVGLVAVARGFEVGVDLERVDPTRDWARLARRYFAPAEIAALDALGGEAAPRFFYRLWTCKEGLIKAKGVTLNESTMRAPAIPLGAEPWQGSVEGWHLRELAAEEGFASTLVTEVPARALILR